MGEKMKKIQSMIKNGEYYEAYNQLLEYNYEYTIENMMRYFPKLSSMEKYCFLMYAYSRKENPFIHMCICELLMIEPFFHYVYPTVYWHVKHALKIDSQFNVIKTWVMSMFFEHPDSPFSKKELCQYATDVLRSSPNDELASKVFKTLS